MNHSLWVVGVCSMARCAAQDWQPAGLPLGALYVQRFFVDSVDDALYCCGYTEYVPWGSPDIGLCSYQDGQWDTLGTFNGAVFSAVRYHDTLVVAGLFTTANSMTCNGIACFDGVGWHPYGQFGSSVRRLRILEGELYAAGTFDTVDGASTYGVAKRVGGAWQVPAPAPQDFDGNVGDIAMYDGQLYVGGAFDFNGGLNDIMRFDGNEWTDVGGSLLGGISGISCMELYGDQLVIGGAIPVLAGNACNNIMSWDGSNWHPLGTGLSDWNNSFEGGSSALGLCVHGGMLYLAGAQYYAGGVPAHGVAQWDGHHWCNVGDADFPGGAWDVAFYHDTLFVASNDSIDGANMNCVARWVGGNFSDTCSQADLVVEPSLANSMAREVFPNPTTSELVLSLPSDLLGSRPEARIYNTLGELVLSAEPRNGHVDVHSLSPGYYTGWLSTDKSRYPFRFVKE